jgi:hypothetical protein
MRIKNYISKFGNGLEAFSNMAVKVIGVLILFYLSLYSFFSTQYMNPMAVGQEFPITVDDTKSRNILCIVAVLAVMILLLFIENKIGDRAKKIIKIVFLLLALVWIAAAGIYWINAAVRNPGSDQMKVSAAASSFLHGDYGEMKTSGYLDMYPHQLGLVALMEIVFFFAGEYNYMAYEALQVIMAVGIVYLGYLIVRELTDSMAALVAYCLIMMGCLPMVFYTSWIYGEIPGIFLSFLAVFLILKYVRKNNLLCLAAGILALDWAVMVRKNSEILVIAFCLAGFVNAVKKRNIKLFIAVIAAALLPYLTFAGIQQYYENISGIEKSEGLSSSCGIALGLQESEGRSGWDFGYETGVYWNYDFDKVKSEQAYKHDIHKRLKYFRENPEYAVSFIQNKISSQWNEPLYQGLYFNYTSEDNPDTETFFYSLYTDKFTKVLYFCDRVQFICFVGVLFYFLFTVKKDDNILKHILPIFVIGGFLFSIIWEAKARYILPYYVAMFPIAAAGFKSVAEKIYITCATSRKA